MLAALGWLYSAKLVMQEMGVALKDSYALRSGMEALLCVSQTLKLISSRP